MVTHSAKSHTRGIPPRTKALKTIMDKRGVSFAQRLAMAQNLVAVVSSNWSVRT